MRQTSRGKFNRLQRATAGFTTSALDGYGLRGHVPARPAPYASYPVLVHRLASLLHASFRPRLATKSLRFAITSPPSGCEEDFHLQDVEQCSAHTQGPRPGGTRRTILGPLSWRKARSQLGASLPQESFPPFHFFTSSLPRLFLFLLNRPLGVRQNLLRHQLRHDVVVIHFHAVTAFALSHGC